MSESEDQNVNSFTGNPQMGSRRSSRRSWFETPPTRKLEIAVEKPLMNSRSKRRSIDDVETLVLSHFTKPPRINFGKIVVGRSRTRILLLQNPTDYEQDVLVERFPYKKHFNVDQTHFVVGPDEVVSLTLTWTPKDAGSCREMILFHINAVYRLQAYMFGTADDPKPIKTSRKGILGTRRWQPPSCVVQTKSLKSIHDSYSPRKSEETLELYSKVRLFSTPCSNQENIKPIEPDEMIQRTPPPLESTGICNNGDPNEQCTERQASNLLSMVSPIPMTTDNSCIMELYFSSAAHEQTPALSSKGKERSPLKTMSENGLSGSGGKHDSNILGNMDRSQNGKFKETLIQNKILRSVESSQADQQKRPVVSEDSRENTESPDFIQHKGTSTNGKMAESIEISHCEYNSGSSEQTNAVERIKMSPYDHCKEAAIQNPIKALCSTQQFKASDIKRKKESSQRDQQRETSVKEKSLENELFQKEKHAVTETALHVSPNSFLNTMAARTTATTPEVGQVCLSGRVSKMTEMVSVSPNSFLEDMGRTRPAAAEKESSIPSPTSVLNDSIPHDIMLQQLKFVRESLHDGSFSGILRTRSAVSPAKLSTQSKRMERLNHLAQPKSYNVFAHAQVQGVQGKKEKLKQKSIHEKANFATGASASSPRRKTFLVAKKPVRKPSPVKLQHDKNKKATCTKRVKNVPSVSDPDLKKGKAKAAHIQSLKIDENEAIGATDIMPGFQKSEANSLPDPMTPRRRSMWASNVAEVFEAPVLASKPECEPMGEELDLLKSHSGQMTEGKESQRASLSHVLPQHLPACLVKSPDAQLNGNETELERKTRQSISCQLFPDASDVLNLSADCKPLWSGSVTVTKDRSSVSPCLTNSVNASKKLFPDIGMKDLTDTKSSATHQSKVKEETFIEKMAQSVSADHQLTSESGRKSQRTTSEMDISSAKVISSQSFECHGTPELLTSPVEQATRRATLTVTKSRPSLAILGMSSNRDVMGVTWEGKNSAANLAKTSEEEEELWQTETIVIETRNNAVVNVSISRELLTPVQLPSSPKSENSRRSTHSIKNPVVLNKEGLMPRSLFPSVQEQEDFCKQTDEQNYSVSESCSRQMEIKQDGKIIQQRENSDKVSNSRSLQVADDFTETERVEHHLGYERDTIVKPTQLPAQDIVLDDSFKNQELSSDSLESENRSAKEVLSESFTVHGQSEGDKSQSASGWLGCKTPLSFKTDSGQGSFLTHSSDSQETQKAINSARELTATCGQTVGYSENDSTDHVPSQQANEFVEPSFDERVTSVDLQAINGQEISPVSLRSSGPSDDFLRAKLSPTKPILFHTIIKEKLLKEEVTSKSGCSTDSLCSQDTSSKEDALHKSSEILPWTHVKGKQPTVSSITETVGQKIKPASATLQKGQPMPRTKSLNSPDAEKQPERLNRKRTSPEAGLKEPRSKRVELEKNLNVPSSERRAATGQSKVQKQNPARGVPMSKLILMKKSKSVLPKHPLAFAARNMYYDERWMDKQERGFVHWLNFVLTPVDEYMLATTKAKVDARSIAFDGTANKVAPCIAPTKEVLSFRAYSARRRLNQLRRASCRLFQTEMVIRVVCRLEVEVEQQRLAVRTDRMIHADIGLKQKILDMLLSYNPLWLRIGLETVFGEVLPIQSNSDVIGMSRFILTRLLTSPEIAAHFAHPTVPHLYHDGYAHAVAQHTMKKFLVLVYFLDVAKQSHLVAHDPCLFCKDAEIKSSKAILVQFSRDYLSGEGDITKHLAYMGYVVSHVQTPSDEFDYAVTNLRTDLRDGLRLARIIMLLSGDWSFASSLRSPAISRLQKIYNVDLVFRQLTMRGFDLLTAKGATLSARDIVDGHREKTLTFLWKLIFYFQTVVMLDEHELQEEVAILEQTLRVKLCMQKLINHPQSTEPLARRDSGGPGVSMDNPVLQLLLKWCRTVCLHYGVKVENLTVSFSDGRALCCLLHHYHPALLPLKSIHFRTTQSIQEAAEIDGEGSGDEEAELSQEWGAIFLGGDIDMSQFDALLANERENFRTLYNKVSELGGVPLMLKAADMSNTIPDERVVVTYVTYLCARLLDLREETRAARIIQLAWRRFCLRRSARLRLKQIAACILIQRAWRQHHISSMKQKQAAAAHVQVTWKVQQGHDKAFSFGQNHVCDQAASLKKALNCVQDNSLRHEQYQVISFREAERNVHSLPQKYSQAFVHTASFRHSEQLQQAKGHNHSLSLAETQKLDLADPPKEFQDHVVDPLTLQTQNHNQAAVHKHSLDCDQAQQDLEHDQLTSFEQAQETDYTFKIVQHCDLSVSLQDAENLGQVVALKPSQEHNNQTAFLLQAEDHVEGALLKQMQEMNQSAALKQIHGHIDDDSPEDEHTSTLEQTLEHDQALLSKDAQVCVQDASFKQTLVHELVTLLNPPPEHEQAFLLKEHHEHDQVYTLKQSLDTSYKETQEHDHVFTECDQVATLDGQQKRGKTASCEQALGHDQAFSLQETKEIDQAATKREEHGETASCEQVLEHDQASTLKGHQELDETASCEQALEHDQDAIEHQEHDETASCEQVLEHDQVTTLKGHQEHDETASSEQALEHDQVTTLKGHQEHDETASCEQALEHDQVTTLKGHQEHDETASCEEALEHDQDAIEHQEHDETASCEQVLEHDQVTTLKGHQEHDETASCEQALEHDQVTTLKGHQEHDETASCEQALEHDQVTTLKGHQEHDETASCEQALEHDQVTTLKGHQEHDETASCEQSLEHDQDAIEHQEHDETASCEEALEHDQAATLKEQQEHDKTASHVQALEDDQALSIPETKKIDQAATLEDFQEYDKTASWKQALEHDQAATFKELQGQDKTASSEQALEHDQAATPKELQKYDQTALSKKAMENGEVFSLQQALGLDQVLSLFESQKHGQVTPFRESQNLDQTALGEQALKQTQECYQASLVKQSQTHDQPDKFYETPKHKQNTSSKQTKEHEQVNSVLKTQDHIQAFLPQEIEEHEQSCLLRKVPEHDQKDFSQISLEHAIAALLGQAVEFNQTSLIKTEDSHASSMKQVLVHDLSSVLDQAQKQDQTISQAPLFEEILKQDQGVSFRWIDSHVQDSSVGQDQRHQQAAIVIQKFVRGYQQRKHLLQMKNSATVTASREISAIRIQTMCRVYKVRQCVHAMKEATRRESAATIIQAFFRACRQHKLYLALQRSVLLVQTHVRGQQTRQRFREMKQTLLVAADYQHTHDKFKVVVAEYHQNWNAAVSIQAAWRGGMQRRKFLHAKSAVTKLQAIFRAHIQRKQYQLFASSVLLIQRKYRAKQIGRTVCRQYQLMLKAAVVIQSQLKAYVLRSYYLQLRARVISAQAHCRRFLARKRFLRLRDTTLCLQSHFRARHLIQKAKESYHKSRQSAICLQAAVRGHQQRCRFLRLQRSCVQIQSALRTCWARRSYQTKRHAIIKLQLWWRTILKGRKIRHDYINLKKSVIVIQSYVRGYLARRQIHHLCTAALTIQRNYRRHQARQNFLLVRQAACILQKHTRAFLQGQGQRRQYLLICRACITIQSACRGFLARQRYLKSVQSAIRIQAIVRRFQQRQRYLSLRKAAVVCQRLYRNKCLSQVFRAAFVMIRNAAVVIQKHQRGYVVRNEYQQKRCAAILLQAHIKCWLHRQEFVQKKFAAICIQRWLRDQKRARAARADYLLMKQSVITIQQSWRTFKQRQINIRIQAALVIQRQVSCFLAQKKFKEDRRKIVHLQACIRGFIARRDFAIKKQAVAKIQQWWRTILLALECHRKFLLREKAAILIQSAFRGHRAYICYIISLQRIIFLQAAIRSYLQWKKYHRLKQVVVSLQRRVRCNAVCRRECKRQAAVCIQRAFRQRRAIKLQERVQATICIQSYVRMMQAMKKCSRLRNATIILQSAIRGHLARKSFRRKKFAIMCIQHHVRFFLVVRSLHQAVHRRRLAAVTLQRAFRKHQVQILVRKKWAALKIQTAFRGFAQRQAFLGKKKAVLRLQAALRRWKAQQRATEMRARVRAAMVLQTNFRRLRTRKQEQLKQEQRAKFLRRFVSVAHHHIAAIKIQHWYRHCTMVRQAQQQLHHIVLLQCHIRAYLQRVDYLRTKQEVLEHQVRREKAAVIIQSAVRSWLVRKSGKHRIQHITRVQALWRGRKLRRSMNNRKIALARKRVLEANEKATEEKKLANRTTSALDFLLHYKQLAYILDALMHLDVATRLSWKCCERLVEVNAVGVIYRLILSCNRSLPHMELIRYSVSILLNLTKYEKTASAVYEAEDSVNTLVDLMSIYRDKGGTIFTKTCMLLAILGTDIQRKTEMSTNKRLVEKLQSIHAVVLRKHRMQVARARVAARSSLNATLPSRLYAPKVHKVRPAWVLKRDSMTEIEDPQAALSFLLDTLHIGPK